MTVDPENVKFLEPLEEQNHEEIYGKNFYITLFVFFGLIIVSILATITGGYRKLEQGEIQGIGGKIVECFDLYKNWDALTTNPRKDDDELAFFDGIRVIAIFWVVLGHTFWYAMDTPAINPDGVQKFTEEFSKAHIYNGTLSVDIFFFLSAFLLAYILLKKSKGQPSVSIILYIHRIIRFYPMIVIALCVFCFVLPSIGDGPLYYRIYEKVNVYCGAIWYKILLFFANYRAWGYQCIDYVWYICIDFQLFIFSPFLIYLYAKNKLLGIIAPVVVILINFGYTIWLALTYDVYASMARYNHAYEDAYYERIYTRGGPYMIGLLAGYFFYEYKSGNGQISSTIFEIIKNNVFVRILLYIIGLTGMFMILQTMYWLNKYYFDVSRAQDLIYLLLYRDLFVSSLFIFLLPAFAGKGRVLRLLFGNQFFNVLGKLSYGIYMTHQLFMEYYTYVKRRPIFFGYSNLAMQFWGFALLATVAAAVSFIFIEQPFFNLEKLVFPTRRTEKPKLTDDDEKTLVPTSDKKATE